MKVFMPLYGVGVRGLFGKHPYPIGVHLPVNLGPYYHPYGWYYQMRRTWHGIVWAAHKYTKSTNPQFASQQKWREVFADGVSIWQGMSSQLKDIYEKWKYPVHASGFNRFLHYYLREHYPPRFFLLLEDGGRILQEDGYKIKLE